MKRSSTLFITLFMIAFVFTSTARAERDGRQVREFDRIQMAILLDTSSSMDGLISQAKAHLWKIVTEMGRANKNGARPRLEVALFEYGNDGLSAETGHIRLVVPLTTDLDKVSEELFRLSTNGGQEYCGMVVQEAVKKLQWSKGGDYRVIFIAGNEPFTQGNVDYRESVVKAKKLGIVVNTVFCGNHDEGMRTNWKDGAVLTGGVYMNIDHNQAIVAVSAPQDAEIIRLNQELNKTYVAYGRIGQEKKSCQEKQDKNAASMNSEVAVYRSTAKASHNYTNDSWDLVDAVKNKKIVAANVREDDLPDEMKKMKASERDAYIAGMAKQREVIQKKISGLSEQRRKYVETEMKKKSSGDSLDSAMLKTIKKQATERNFRFE